MLTSVFVSLLALGLHLHYANLSDPITLQQKENMQMQMPSLPLPNLVG